MITCKEMADLEAQANSNGISYMTMMENAGQGAASIIMEKMEVKDRKIAIICGSGNNGGDGFVIGRILKVNGAQVILILPQGKPKTDAAMANYLKCKDLGIATAITGSENFAAKALTLASHQVILGYQVIIDCLYGTGFHGQLSDQILDLVSIVNQSKGFKVAIDIPSGLNGDNDSGPLGSHVNADLTVTFHDTKPIHQNPKAQLGQVIVCPIGI